jgi:hypothetical protein
MSSTSFTVVKENPREQVLSTDLNRMQKLASREAQDRLLNASLGSAFESAVGAPVAMQEAPVVNRADDLGTIVGNAGTFVVNLSAGSGFVYILNPDADGSSYSPVKWDAQAFTITPDATQVRADLVYATPAMVDTDAQSKNVLVDPVARTVAPAVFNKTSNPVGTVTVLTGTPGSALAPACPAGSLPLWEVVTRNVDVDSTAFRFIPRIWRRVESFGSCHAILRNCVPTDGGLHAESVNVAPYLPDGTIHKAVIDGEVICAPLPSGAHPHPVTAIVDSTTGNNPLAATIDANKDVFCYLYLCGGRHAPQNGIGSPVPTYAPLQLVASLQPPQYGRSTDVLGINGVNVPKEGTLYVGVWAIAATTHNYKSCLIDGDWVYARTTGYDVGGNPKSPSVAFISAQPVAGATGAITLPYPTPSTLCDLLIEGVDSVTDVNGLQLNQTLTSTPRYPLGTYMAIHTVGASIARMRTSIPPLGQMNYTGGNATTTVAVVASAYNMNVQRIG